MSITPCDCMSRINTEQLPLIEKILSDEAWLEGERRNAPVSIDDPVVIDRAMDIVLRIGSRLRARARARICEQCDPKKDSELQCTLCGSRRAPFYRESDATYCVPCYPHP